VIWRTPKTMTDSEYIPKSDGKEISTISNRLAALILENTFLSRIRSNMEAKATAAFGSNTREQAGVFRALGDLEDAINDLHDAPHRHQEKQLARQVAIQRKEIELIQLEHQKAALKIGHEAHLASLQTDELEDLPKDLKELTDHFLAKVKPLQRRAVLEQALGTLDLPDEAVEEGKRILEETLGKF